MSKKIAIIGTGITALSIGYHLPAVLPKVEITYIDKARKVGGRLATRRTRIQKNKIFDHGAPFFERKHLQIDLFKKLSEQQAIQEIELISKTYSQSNQLNENSQTIKNVWIGKDGNQSIAECLYSSISNISHSHFNSRVKQIHKDKQNNLYEIITEKEEDNQKKLSKIPGQFNMIFCCIPFQQAKQIKQTQFNFQTLIKSQPLYHVSWIIMVTAKKDEIANNLFDKLIKSPDIINFDKLANDASQSINFAVRQNKKFCLQSLQSQNWTFYMCDQWSRQNKNLSRQQIALKFIHQLKMKCIKKQIDIEAKDIFAHRWLFCRPQRQNSIIDYIRSQNIVFCGDWVENKQFVGECWQLGKRIAFQIVQQEKNKENKEETIKKSNL